MCDFLQSGKDIPDLDLFSSEQSTDVLSAMVRKKGVHLSMLFARPLTIHLCCFNFIPISEVDIANIGAF